MRRAFARGLRRAADRLDPEPERIRIEELGLLNTPIHGMRIYSALRRFGINYVDELDTLEPSDLLALPNFGERSLEVLQTFLAER